MDKAKVSQTDIEMPADESRALADLTAQVEAISAARIQSDLLVASIKEQAATAAAKSDDIEKMFLFAEKAKSELDSQIIPTREAAATLSQEVEGVRANVAEVKTLSESLQAINAQTKETNTQAAAALEVLRAFANTASEQALSATGKSEQIEQMRLQAEKAKTDLDAQNAAMRDAVATFNQQAEAVRANIAELNTLSTSLQATNSQTKDTSTQATAALEALRTLANTASENAGRIEALKSLVEQAAQVAEQRSRHIEDGRKYVDEKRAEIDVIANTAQQSASNAEAQHQASRTTVESFNTLCATVHSKKVTTESDAEAVAKLRQQSEEHTVIAKKLADVAQTIEQRVAEYESRLAELERTAADRLRTIEGYLPGAASAGLASAFNLRRKDFKWRPRLWQGAFVLSIVGLLVLAVLELYATTATTLTWDQTALSLLRRLPFALPLIWLAFSRFTQSGDRRAHRGRLWLQRDCLPVV